MSDISIAVDAGGTITPQVLLLTATPVDTVDLEWIVSGSTFEGFRWVSYPVDKQPNGLSTPQLTLAFTPPMFAFQIGQVLNLVYTITLANGNTGTGMIQIASAWAYPDTYSIDQGDTLQLHVATNAPYVGLNVYPVSAWTYMNEDDGTPQWTQSPLYTTEELLAGSTLGSTLAPMNASGSGVEDWEWPANVQVPTDGDWPTGIYIVEIGAYASATAKNKTSMTWVMFVVKNPAPQPGARMLYKWPINTIQAYSMGLYGSLPNLANTWDTFDNSFYINQSPPAATSEPSTPFKLTYRRPTCSAWDYKGLAYDFQFVRWLNAQKFEVDYCTDVDVEVDTDLAMLSNYPAVLFRGHDEYLGAQTYVNLTNYRNAGGNLVFLSGNTCCWRVHFTDVDPVLNIPTGVTVNKGLQSQLQDVVGPDAWWKIGPTPRDSALVGAATRNAAIIDDLGNPYYTAYLADDRKPPFVPPSPGYRVRNTDHWIFANSGLPEGFTIGLADIGQTPPADQGGIPPATTIIENLIGYEEDGARINAAGQLTFTDGTPSNFALLGVGLTEPTRPATSSAWPSDSAPPATGWWRAFTREEGDPTDPYAATMGTYSAYGSVFSGSTIHWVTVLDEVDYNAGDNLNRPYSPYQWNPGNDVNGHPIMGNPYVHYITRNVLTAFSKFRRNVAAVGDLNGDGTPDLLLQSAGTGEPSYWLMNGTARSSAGSILYDGSGAPGQTWRMAGIASLTSPASTEILFQNPENGALWYWTIDSSMTRTASAPLVPMHAPGGEWKMSAILAPPKGTAGATLLFQNQHDGSLYFWQLDGTTKKDAGELVPSFAPGNLDLVLVAAVDLNGDGNQELVFQAGSGGALTYWTLDGMKQGSTGSITGPAVPGNVVGGGAFGGSPTLVFQDSAGALTYWTMSNYEETGSGSFTPGSNPWFLGVAS